MLRDFYELFPMDSFRGKATGFYYQWETDVPQALVCLTLAGGSTMIAAYQPCMPQIIL